MKIQEARKKSRIVKNLITEFETLDAIANAMEKSKIKSLSVPSDIETNIQNRRDAILIELEKLLK